MPLDKKARQLVAMPVSELVAARLLIAYHLAHQRPMMGSFLDALGIAPRGRRHRRGGDAQPAARRKLLAAAERDRPVAYPADDVALYLSTLLWQDPETWGALCGAPQRQVAPTSEAAGRRADVRLE